MTAERLLVLGAVAIATALLAVWWKWRDGRIVEAHGFFDAAMLGVPRRSKASATVVTFTGEGCAPCVVVKQRLDSLAEEIGDLQLVTVDAGERLDLADRYGVRRVPTVFIADEKLRIQWRASGVPSDSDLREALLGPEWAGRPHPDSFSVPSA